MGDFLAAAHAVKQLKERPPNSDLLDLYSLYKQATVGDVNVPQPWAVQVEARAKWDAWNALKGVSREKAMKDYVVKARALGATW